MNPTRRRLRHERGAVALEFVQVLPFLLLLMFGIIDVSLVLCDKAVITNAAGEAVRQGVVLRVPPLDAAQITSVALAYAQPNLITGGTASTPAVSVSPAGGCAATTSGDPLQVTITYSYSGLMLGSALEALTGPVTVTAVAVKNCE